VSAGCPDSDHGVLLRSGLVLPGAATADIQSQHARDAGDAWHAVTLWDALHPLRAAFARGPPIASLSRSAFSRFAVASLSRSAFPRFAVDAISWFALPRVTVDSFSRQPFQRLAR